MSFPLAPVVVAHAMTSPEAMSTLAGGASVRVSLRVVGEFPDRKPLARTGISLGVRCEARYTKVGQPLCV